MRKKVSFLLIFWGCLSANTKGQSVRSMEQLLDTGYFAKKKIDPIKIDGNILEKTWENAQRATNFIQNFPNDSMLSKSRTEIMVSYDDKNLYIAARMYNTVKNQSYVTPSLKRDFRGEANDAIVVSIDPFMDRMNSFSFGINPFGVQREGLVVNGGVQSDDLSLSWDNKWYAESKINEDYWSMEMAIPFNTIRFRNGSQKWLVNFYRLDSYNAERSGWARVPNQYAMISLAFNKPLEFETPINKKGPNISLIPFVSPGIFRNPVVKNPNNREFNTKSNLSFGGDAKIGIGSSLNLDLTVNPDFSQVEVDNQVTNLDRFEILFPEKRQFFLENGDLFANFGVEGVRPFFSRRIGVTRDPGTGQNIQNKIDAGLRLSGKIGDDLRLGVMQMRTAAIDSIGQAANNFSVIALQQKVFTRSSVGMIFTNKEVVGSTDFNRVAGVDYNIASKSNVVNGKLFYMMSFDPTRTVNDKAYGGSIVYNKRGFESRQRLFSIGKEFNPEVGYLRRGGFIRYAGDAMWKYYPRNSRINRHGPMADYDFTYFSGIGITDYDLNAMYNIAWKDYTQLLFRFRRDYTRLTEDFDPTNTGGVRLKANESFVYYSIICSLVTDQRKKLAAKLQTRSGQYFNGNRLNLDGELSYRIQPLGSISSVFSFNRLRFPSPYKSADLILIGPKIDLTFSRSMFLSTLIQYNNQINNINTNIRFQWRFAPASDIFLVYTDNYYADTYRSKGSALVLKATYWLNL
ncbi:MAG: DUF5916 domain-containing protein [Chitinophagia bacterium]|jgi:hypothetical protein